MTSIEDNIYQIMYKFLEDVCAAKLALLVILVCQK